MCKKILTIIVLIIASHNVMAGETELIHLGVMSHDCSVLNKSGKNKLSVKFKLSPVEAALEVKANSKYGCFIKMGFGVYADNQYYYYANNNLLFGKTKNIENIKKYSFIVQANTGKLMVKPKYE